LQNDFLHRPLWISIACPEAFLYINQVARQDISDEVVIFSGPSLNYSIKFITRFAMHLHDGSVYEYDLKTNHSDHADGDTYIVDMIIGKPLSKGHSMATLAKIETTTGDTVDFQL
jgi:hypothetical protein